MDEVQQTVEIWKPPADRTADYDAAVDLRLRSYAKTRSLTIGFALLYLALALLLIALSGIGVVGVFFLLIGVWALVGLTVSHASVGRWIPSLKLLVGSVPARRVQAQVLSRKGHTAVLSVNSGETHLLLRAASWPVRQVIARTGEIWLVGPDDRGMAAVFVDSSPAPLPAQVVAAGPERSEQEPVAASSIHAAQDELPLWQARRRARIQWIPIATMALFAVGYFIDYFPSDSSMDLFAEVFILVMLVQGLVRTADLLRMPSLLKAGQWRGYPVTVQAWRGEPRLFGDLGLMLTMPSGDVLPVTVKQASDVLVANIKATGKLWVVGEPEAGKLTAVGIPGYPIVGAARFVVNRKVHTDS